MATLVGTTVFVQAKQIGVTTYTVKFTADGVNGSPRAATAGNTLVLKAYGGATITAKITNSGGASFTLPANGQAASTQAVSVQYFVAVGGETQAFITLNGAENLAVVIEEYSGLGAFIAASNGIVSPAAANDWQSKPSAAVTVSGNAVLLGACAINEAFATAPFSAANRWRQVGPFGAINANFGNQPGLNSQFIAASLIADVTAAASYPADLTAGQYKLTSVWNQNTNTSWFVQAAFVDNSGVPTVPAAANTVMAENSLPGTDQGNWFPGLNGGTNATIAGYCDKLSYQPGQTVNFKVDSTSHAFRVEIYRRGWYGWENMGARHVLGNQSGYITGTVVAQSAPSVDATLGSTSCAWTTNATWTIPAGAVPGVYQAIFRRTDVTTNFSIALFTVRPASVASKVVVVIPDHTYAAYNVWGATTDSGTLGSGTWTGRSIYQIGTDGGTPNFAHRAYAACFDRPMSVQATQTNTWFDDAEYGVVHFLEAQGYDLAYLSTADLDNDPTILTAAALVLVNGHHEYLTPNAYTAFTNARDAAVNMAFFSSNTALWRVRFAAGDTNKRTMICYKESGSVDVSAGFDGGTGRDPVSYTGTWRDSRTAVAPNNTDVRRENALTGQLFLVSTPSNVQATVPFASKTVPIWRNSPTVQALTVGNTYTHPYANIGDEVDLPDGSAGQPSNMVQLSPTIASWSNGANANGSAYHTTITNATATFTLYWSTASSLVFNTGSWRGWWGVSRFAKGTFNSAIASVSVDWQNALLAIMYDLGARSAQITALRPGIDATPTDPATGAPVGSRDVVALAYGLTVVTPTGATLATSTTAPQLASASAAPRLATTTSGGDT